MGMMEAGSRNNIRILRQKLNEDGEDRINNLPECIQLQILSYLPTKDVVRTSVLSKTWFNLWTSSHNICFNDHDMIRRKTKGGKKSFIDFISRVLVGLTNNLNIQNFSLNLASKYDPCLVNLWISAILNRSVKNFIFRYSKELNDVYFSNSLFKSISLVKLELEINCTLSVPSFVDLPNLKHLILRNIKFRSESCSHSSEIILNFPALRKFESHDCLWTKMKTVNLQVPSLVEVYLLSFKSYNYSGLVEPNNCVTIKFCSSHLRKFYYNGRILQDYVLSDPSLALNASAILLPFSNFDVRVCKLLKQFSQVKHLKLVPSEGIRFFIEDLPTFTMLQHLELNSLTSNMLMKILLKSPNLTTLEATEITMQQVSEVEEVLRESTCIPKCMINTLEVIKIAHFAAREDELCLIKFFIKNALVLKHLNFRWSLPLTRREEAREKVFSLEKPSTLTIDFF